MDGTFEKPMHNLSNIKGLKKIINVSQTRSTDNYTIRKKGISSLELMESAAFAFVKAIEKKGLISKKVMVVCGTGNNGGDGLAVCRLLRNRGISATAILVKFKETLSEDCKANLKRIDDAIILNTVSEIPDLSHFDIIIDALLGTGLNSPVRGFVAKVIEAINNAGKTVYSIDVPSGLICDDISGSECIVQSDLVISFQRPKLSFFFSENGSFVKNWEVVDIGLDEPYIQSQESDICILDEKVSNLVKQRPRQSHKGTYGHALVMAGSHGKIGAAVLAAKACLRSGAGLLTTCVPKCGYEILQISVPESMCLTDPNPNILTEMPDIRHYDSIGIGPGIGKDGLTISLLETVLKKCTQSLVLDADALNIISENPGFLEFLPENTILTPHIKEFDRLVGTSENSMERLKKQQEFSQKHKVIIVLKDAYTCISSVDGKLFFNTSGNQGMATGGSGDTLTGIITGLLAQKYQPLQAAFIGVYFHGLAGDRATKHKGYHALIASDIIENFNINN